MPRIGDGVELLNRPRDLAERGVPSHHLVQDAPETQMWLWRPTFIGPPSADACPFKMAAGDL